MSTINKVLIVGITPYFLDKGNFWFEENLHKILETRKTQSFFEDNTLYIERNQVYNLSHFLRKLDEIGYEKVLHVSEPGEFATRGGIVDVFPINSDMAWRVEFLGNAIEQISALPVKIASEEKSKEILKKRLKSQKLFSDLKGLKPGDCLVHLDHGVARFCGIEKSQKFQTLNYYLLEYAAGDKLYVPVGLERKLSRYIGFASPKISRLGSPVWQRTKKRIKEEAEKFAKELLEIYAKREVALRPPYAIAQEIEAALASDFPFEETPDQIQALQDIKSDLEKDAPMDRIVCGDVGFGKTEIALRAMVQAVNAGYQAVLICPTTILAQQHYQNFSARLQNLPLRTALLSRLQSKREQKEITKNLKSGQTDIVVGTHRLLSKDVDFKNLGLLVIDDEQRFGVKQKEKLKQLRASLDILSLSATPIPRTLYMALSSLKNISLIQTPPEGRLPVKTHILPFSEKIIKKAIKDELARSGQVYYLHNRVETLGLAKKLLGRLDPDLKIGVVHGRLREKELLKAMQDFQQKKTNLLLATTIIENGLDLPNVNTLIVADAAKLGLAQAYQIRGRIGRSHTQAFAFFLHARRLNDKAKLRLKALKEAEEIGSGYRVALKDLEIRGAGNVLGKEQSGNINQVGLNLYCQMLYHAISSR